MMIRAFSIILSLSLCGVAQAQIASQSAPVTVFGATHGVISARSSALGEAMSAAYGDPTAWNSNPAVVAVAAGIGAHYLTAHRSHEVSSYSTDWSGAGVWIATPVVNAALHFVRNDLGNFKQTFTSGDTGTDFTAYNEAITLTLARRITGPISIGVNIKYLSDKTIAILPTDGIEEAKASGLYADIGATAAIAGLLTGGPLRDSAYAGLAVQDLGGTLTYNDLQQSVTLGQWIRVGGAYSIAAGDSAATTFRGTLSGEYSRLLNGDSRQNKPYVGVGIEGTLFELASLRVGARFYPSNPVLANESTSSTTFGIGVNLPLSRIGLDIPLAVGADFTKLPEMHNDIPDDKGENAFEFRVAYTGALFGK
jgi:hypothetical protein